MAGMLDLRDVLELVVDRLYDGSLSQQHLVSQGHQAVFHVLFELGDHLNAMLEQLSEQRLRDVAFVTKELAEDALDQFRHRLSVINVTRS